MMLFISGSGLSDTFWTAVIIPVTTALLLVLLFWLHRRNTYKRIEALEEKILGQDQDLLRQGALQNEKLKKAMQLHLSELNQRIGKHEELSHKMINQLQALAELMEEKPAEPASSEESSTQLPDGDSGITIQQTM